MRNILYSIYSSVSIFDYTHTQGSNDGQSQTDKSNSNHNKSKSVSCVIAIIFVIHFLMSDIIIDTIDEIASNQEPQGAED